MKLSIFNNIVQIEKNVFIYNSLTESLLRLDEKYAKSFNRFCESKNLEDLNKDLFENLLKGKMLVDGAIDEIDNLKIMHNIARYSNSTCSLTIAPTMQCNFRCPYCYENNIKRERMSKETVNKTLEFLKQIRNDSSALSVAWYGGEPLLAMDIIEQISKYAISLYGEKYSASMVTNGYLLDIETAIKLKELRITQIQITIDGPPHIHNKLRRLPFGEDTFFVILNNITKALENNTELKITIRVNTSKNNIEYIEQIMPYIDKYGLTDKIGLYLAPVDNINNTCNASECLSNTEFAIEQMKFIKSNYKKGYNFIHLPQRNIGVCGAIAPNCYVIDASGDLYKCWDTISDKTKKVGSIYENIELNTNLSQWLKYDCFNDKECIQCSFLPACMGGCPHKNIKSKEKSCIPFKYYREEMIELLYELYNRKKL